MYNSQICKTLEDIVRLEEVIGLQKAMTAMDYQKQVVFDEGIQKGEFNIALKIKDVLGIEKALELTDFSRSELESGKLNNR